MTVQESDKEIDVDYLKTTVNKSALNRMDKKWIDAFTIFNKQSHDRPLGMNCVSCYYKVLRYFVDKTNGL